MSSIKIGGFDPESAFAKSLIPILDAVEWSGSNIDLIESLVDDANNMDKDGLIETLANLKIKTHVSRLKKVNKKTNIFPALYIAKKSIYLLVGYKNKGFLVYDTGEGKYILKKKIPRGKKIIIFSKLDPVDSNMLKPQKNWFFHLLSRFKKEIFYTVIISLIITSFSFITPLFIILIHSQIRTSINWVNILYLGVAALAFILSVIGFKSLRSYLLTYLSSRIGNLVSNEIFRRILYLPPKYIDTSSVRSQLSRIKDFESITDFFSGSSLVSLLDIPLSLLMIIGLSFIAGSIVFIPLTAYILLLSTGLISYNVYRRINKRDINSVNEKNKIQNEMLIKMPFIRLSGNKERWFDQFENYFSKSLYQSHKSSTFLLIINTLSHGVVNISLILSIAFGVIKVINGEMSSGVLFSSFIIISRILIPLRSGFSTLSQLSKLRMSINQLNNFMSLPIEDRPKSITTISDQLNGEIKFNSIFLRYGHEITPALINIKMNPKRNETTIITGHGGCGKSSIIKLLLALYTPLSGNITVDNINLLQLDKIQLRKTIAYLPAVPYLFPGSLRYNLYLAKPDATDKQLSRAMALTDIDKLLPALPNGLDTDIKNIPAALNNDSFIKRVNFTMMLLRESPLYLIDSIEVGMEPSDYMFFFNVIKSIKGTSTIIITTNKEEFISLGDTLITMDSGRIVNIKDRRVKSEEKI